MKKILIALLVTFLVCYAQENRNLIVVTGEGVIESEPDLATIQLGVSVQKQTATEAYEDANAKVNEIIKSLLKTGVKKEDIKTQSIGLYPQYEYPEGSQRLIGYQMHHNLSIKIKDMKKLANVIDAATLAGVNTISNINFGFQESEKLMSQARINAIVDATKKAGELAKAANIVLGKIVQITESTYPTQFGESNYIDKVSGSGQIAPGLSSVKVTVVINYEIKSQ